MARAKGETSSAVALRAQAARAKVSTSDEIPQQFSYHDRLALSSHSTARGSDQPASVFVAIHVRFSSAAMYCPYVYQAGIWTCARAGHYQSRTMRKGRRCVQIARCRRD